MHRAGDDVKLSFLKNEILQSVLSPQLSQDRFGASDSILKSSVSESEQRACFGNFPDLALV